MSDRIRLPLPALDGLLVAEVGMDHPAGSVGSINRTLNRVFVGLQSPSTSDVTVELRSAAAAVASVTISGGSASAEVTDGSTILADTEMYLRVTDAGGNEAANLYGWFELEGDLGDSPAASALTTLGLVRAITKTPPGGPEDVRIAALIGSVSRQIQQWLRRPIVLQTSVGELHSANGMQLGLRLDHYPVTSVAEVRVCGVAMDSADWYVDTETGLLFCRSSCGVTPWSSGDLHIEVDYQHGFVSIPSDIQEAATLMVVWQFSRDRRTGLRSTINDDGALQATYLVDAWDPVARSILAPYRDVGLF